MDEEYDQLLDIVAENPGAAIKEITELAADHSIASTDVPDTLSEAVGNNDLVEFDDRYWVMRTGKYRFHAYDHPET